MSPVPSLDALSWAETEGRLVLTPSRRDERAGWPVLDVIDRFVIGDARSESFVWHLRSLGCVTRVTDVNGSKGLVPNELASQHLTDRVLSLVAVDYVANPLDYEDRVAICRTCSAITFRDNARETHDCGEHRMNSGIRPRVDVDDIVFEDGDVDEGEVRKMLAQI